MVQLCLTGDIFVAYRQSIDDVPLTTSKYDFRFRALKQEDFEDFSSIYDYVSNNIAPLYDIAFSGTVAVQGASVSKYNIVAYYPTCTDNREVELNSGEAVYDIAPGELFISENISYELNYDTAADNGTEVFFNGGIFLLKGTGYVNDGTTFTPETLDYARRIYCHYDDLFNIIKRIGGISFQFKKPLSNEQENDLLIYMNEHYEDLEYTAPIELPEQEKNEYSKQLIISLLIIIVCVISCFELMEYYYLSKQTEYSVFRICGASVYDIVFIKFKDLLRYTSVSFAIGTFLYIIVSLFLTKATIVSLSFWYFYIFNMVFFMLINAICFLGKGMRV